jgi:hypothetical protein
MIRFLKLVALVVVVASAAQFLLVQLNKIDREVLGIADIQENMDCQRLTPPDLWSVYNDNKDDLDINRELVANDFAFYAAMAYDAYKDCGDANECKGKSFYEYEQLTTPWKVTKVSPLSAPNGFRAIAFENISDTALNVLVAFRGTDGLDVRDYWYGNFSWLTQWIVSDDQYAAARAFMQEIVHEATTRARAMKTQACFTAVGHSLGDGLAQHVAYGFPNTSAVAIDSSPVLNHFRFKEPFDGAKIFHIHERGDLLSWVYERLIGRYTPNNVHYPINLIELDCEKAAGVWKRLCQFQYLAYKNHDMFAVSEGMSRMVMDCRLHTEGCEIGVKRPLSVTALELACRARRSGSGLDLCSEYERKFGTVPRGATISVVQ